MKIVNKGNFCNSIQITFTTLEKEKILEVFESLAFELKSLKPAYKNELAVCSNAKDSQYIEEYLTGYKNGRRDALFAVPFFSIHEKTLSLTNGACDSQYEILKKILETLFNQQRPIRIEGEHGESYEDDLSDFPYLK